MAYRDSLVRRIDPIAAGWGGLIASIGAISTTSRDWPVRLAVTALTFGMGGFLAGVRSAVRRPSHAVAAAFVGIGLHVVFVGLTWVGSRLGGPSGALLTPGGSRGWVALSAWSIACAFAGGLVADALLGKAARRVRR
ncbi:MAG: hypothetical protein HYX33_01780 [Actinobacteria bacterium]|nr:hypothetical protein [Actinomycetota bacterium]